MRVPALKFLKEAGHKPHVPRILKTFDTSLPDSRGFVEVPVAMILQSCSRLSCYLRFWRSSRTTNSKLHVPRPWRVRVAVVHIPTSARKHHPLHCQDMHSTESPVPGMRNTMTLYTSQCDLLRLETLGLSRQASTTILDPDLDSWTPNLDCLSYIWILDSRRVVPCNAFVFCSLSASLSLPQRGNGDQLLTIA